MLAKIEEFAISTPCALYSALRVNLVHLGQITLRWESRGAFSELFFAKILIPGL